MSTKQTEYQLKADTKSLLDSALNEKLSMTIEQRIESHENARQLCEDLRVAGEALRAKPQSAT